eukprot:scaffold18923_cov78-Skeletonema_dohrnii-CCMP3373.AAC.1
MHMLQIANRDFGVGRHQWQRQVASHPVMVPYPDGVPGRWYSKGWNGRLVRKIERMLGMEGKDFEVDRYPHERWV